MNRLRVLTRYSIWFDTACSCRNKARLTRKSGGTVATEFTRCNSSCWWMIMEYWWIDNWQRKTESTGDNSASGSLFPPQIPVSTCSVGGQSQNALLATASFTDHHDVTLVHTQHPVHSGQMFQNVFEQHKIQSVVLLVVLLQNLSQNRNHSCH